MDILLNEISNLEENIQLCWVYFITSKINDGMECIDKVFVSIDNVINTINKEKLINIDINEIQNIFNSLERALKIPDYILIADLLKYEVKPLIESWKVNLNDQNKIY